MMYSLNSSPSVSNKDIKCEKTGISQSYNCMLHISGRV